MKIVILQTRYRWYSAVTHNQTNNHVPALFVHTSRGQPDMSPRPTYIDRITANGPLVAFRIQSSSTLLIAAVDCEIYFTHVVPFCFIKGA